MPAIMQEPLCPGSLGWVRVDAFVALHLPGLYHLYGAPHSPFWLQGPTAYSQAGLGGEAVQVWPHLPHLLPGGHVQQWEQG